jgi:hypothetical protein
VWYVWRIGKQDRLEQIRINRIVRDTLWNGLEQQKSLYTTYTMGSGGGIVLLRLGVEGIDVDGASWYVVFYSGNYSTSGGYLGTMW